MTRQNEPPRCQDCRRDKQYLTPDVYVRWGVHWSDRYRTLLCFDCFEARNERLEQQPPGVGAPTLRV